jgi:hypothetical protein
LVLVIMAFGTAIVASLDVLLDDETDSSFESDPAADRRPGPRERRRKWRGNGAPPSCTPLLSSLGVERRVEAA